MILYILIIIVLMDEIQFIINVCMKINHNCSILFTIIIIIFIIDHLLIIHATMWCLLINNIDVDCRDLKCIKKEENIIDYFTIYMNTNNNDTNNTNNNANHDNFIFYILCEAWQSMVLINYIIDNCLKSIYNEYNNSINNNGYNSSINNNSNNDNSQV